MSANIEYNEKRKSYSFVEANKRETAWHQLGKRFDQDGITITEAISACNADYEVAKQPIVALTPQMVAELQEGKLLGAEDIFGNQITNKMATMRLDNNKVLGVVGDGYGIVQNADAFKFIDQLVGGNLDGQTEKPIIDAAGVLGNGERIFVTAKFDRPMMLDNNGNDPVEFYVVFTTSHDGSGAVNAMVTPVRVVCNNTLNMAFKNNYGKMSLRHTINVNARMDLTNAENADFALKTLKLYTNYREEFEQKIKALQNMRVSDDVAKDVLAQVFLPAVQYDIFKTTKDINADGISGKARNQYLASVDALYNAVGQAETQTGTGLWVANGVSSLFQNHANTQSATGEKGFDNITNGVIQQKLQEVCNILFAMNYANAKAK